jgi:hypothetical protein
MHIEVLVEDSSGKKLLESLFPKILGEMGAPHTWRLISYKGIGRVPKGLIAGSDASKRILLNQLPRLLRGYKNTSGVDRVAVVLDSDKRDCRKFLGELLGIAKSCHADQKTLFRLAIEEIEAWYLGDRDAVLQAYPRAKKSVLDRYEQDAVCGTWELLADAVVTGGSEAVKRQGWPHVGQIKHAWAEKIGPLMVPERNVSPSFGKLRSGLHRIVADS